MLEELGNTATSSWNTKGTVLEELGNTATSSWNTKGTLLEELGNTATLSWNTKGTLLEQLGKYSKGRVLDVGILRGHCRRNWVIQPRQVGILRGAVLEELGNTATSSWNTK